MMSCMEPEQCRLSHWRRLTYECVLAFHGVIAAGWWWLTPGGFSVGHVRFWLNRVWPLALLAIAVFGIWTLARRRHSALTMTLLILAVLWLSFAISARIVFPVTAPRLWCWGLLVGSAVLALVARWKKPVLNQPAGLVSEVVLGALLGSFVPWALRSPEPCTRPIGGASPSPLVGIGLKKTVSSLSLNPSVSVLVANGDISVQQDAYRLEISPFLGFSEISPDRCWSSLIPNPFQPQSRQLGQPVSYLNDDSTVARIRYDSRSLIVSSRGSRLTEITAASTLSEATYSHINSFCRLTVRGHRRLFLRFSPCRDARIEVLPADYPTGRPARLAYRTASRFVVAEASTGEKGPFHKLASGSLQAHDPVIIFLEDEEREIGSLRFDDWAVQASIEPSPTEGWGLPQNAIEFQLEGDAPNSAADIWLTLAATAVGRGWDTVGHSAGTYRNRMQIRIP